MKIDLHLDKPRFVYVIDDDQSVRDSLEFRFAAQGITTLSFANAKDFLENLPDLRPGLILVDVRMAGMNGLDLIQELGRRDTGWPIIVLTGHGEVPLAVEAMKLGAAEFLEKSTDTKRIEEVLAQEFASLDLSLESRRAEAAAKARYCRLTCRQREVLEALMLGLSNKQVAFNLSLSPRTVEMHRAAALNRLAVRTIAEAMSLKGKAGV